jgi:hypothetical protein
MSTSRPEWVYGETGARRRTAEDVARLVARDLEWAPGGTGEQWARVGAAPRIETVYAGSRQISHFVITDMDSGLTFTVAVSPADRPRV